MDTTRLKTEIEVIYNAYAEGSVTNEMVAGLFEGVLRYAEELSGKHDLLAGQLADHKARFETLLGDNASSAIDNFNEVLAFLEGITDDEKLVGKINEIRTSVTNLGKYRTVKSVGLVSDDKRVELNIGRGSLSGSVDEFTIEAIPLAVAPTSEGGAALPVPGRAGIVSAEDFGRFEKGAKYADTMRDRLDGRKVVEELEAEASAEGVELVQHRWRPDGGRVISLADAGGDASAQSDADGSGADADGGVAAQADGSGVAADGSGVTDGAAAQAEAGTGSEATGGVEINQHPYDVRLRLPVASTEQAGVMTAAQVEKLEGAGEAGFRELWTSAYGCSVNDAAPASERYVCNGLGMSLAEAKAVYHAGRLDQLPDEAQYRNRFIRTNLPPYQDSTYPRQYNLHCAFHNSDIEIAAVNFDKNVNPPATWTQAFAFCSYLHTVIGPVNRPTADTFHRCKKLQNVTFALDANCKSFSLVDCPLISLASMQTIPARSANRTAQISVTVHADVYAKLTDPEGHPEWVQVVLDAAAKNIIFTTA